MILGVDVGGTFTDAVLFDGAALFTAKAPTTPKDQSLGVVAAVELVLDRAGVSPSEIEHFAHGMTVGTNALLEETGARTALVATEGFTDLLEIARQDRPSLYRLNQPKARPLVPSELSFGVAERCGPNGPIEPLTDDEIERVARLLEAADPEAVAICLLFSFSHPEHEVRLVQAITERLPGRPVRASHQVLAQFREYERCSTTVIDAYLAPPLSRYLSRLSQAAERIGLPQPRIMQSSGGVIEADEAVGSGAWSVLSGPAGGAVGAAAIAVRAVGGDAIGLDMGGTSCDVCLVQTGQVRHTDSREIDGRVIQLPMVDIETVGAGGGSIAWADEAGALRVGPRSAGSEPGPACYGRGGSQATVTDANLFLGRLPAGETFPGGLILDFEAAERAIADLAASLKLDPLRAAEGIIQLADQEMAAAVRRMTVERGVDPRRFALLPFGGAGPMHAAGVAEQLGVERIACPRAGGVLSALGLCASDRRKDAARTVLLAGEEIESAEISATIAELAATLGATAEDRVDVVCAMRYRGQSFELDVEAGRDPDPEQLRQGFERQHQARYGFTNPDAAIELVTIKVAVVSPGPDLLSTLATRAPDRVEEREATGTRRAHFGGRWYECEIFKGELPPGQRFQGPAIAEMPGATLVVPPGGRAEVDPLGTVLMELSS